MHSYVIVKDNTYYLGKDREGKFVWSDDQIFSSRCLYFSDFDNCIAYMKLFKENHPHSGDLSIKNVFENKYHIPFSKMEKKYIIKAKNRILAHFINPLSFQEDIDFREIPESIFDSKAIEFDTLEDAREFLEMRKDFPVYQNADIVEIGIIRVY